MNTKIEDVLDLCITGIGAGKAPEEMLRQYPDVADELRPLLAMVSELQNVPGPSTPAKSLTHTMAKLLVQQTHTKGNQKHRKVAFLFRSVLARAAAVILIIFLAGWTTLTSSAQALPGDLLYPVKRFGERVRFLLTVNQESKAELRIVFAEKRVKELVKDYSKDGGLNKTLLSAMLDEAKMALDAGPELPEVSRGLLNSRVAFLSLFQKHTLEQLEKQINPEEKQDLKKYLDTCCMRCCKIEEILGRPKPDPSERQSEQGQGCGNTCPIQ